MKLPLYNIVLGEADGIEIMSLVEHPAVERDFLAFEKQKQLAKNAEAYRAEAKFSLNEEQHIVFGVAIRADFPIYRIDNSGYEYYVIFNKETIKQLRDKFMYDKRTDLVNLEHSKGANNIYLIDSFIKDTSKGISPAGFEDIEDGSWFVSYKVDNEQVWNKIKSGEFRGFSIEGVFEFTPKDELEDLIDEILQK